MLSVQFYSLRFVRSLSVAVILSFFSIPPVLARAFDPIKAAEDARQVNAPALATSIQSSDPVTRARVAVAYGRIMKPEGITPLLKLVKDPSDDVKKAAIFALGQMGWTTASLAGHEDDIFEALRPYTGERAGGVAIRLVAIEAIGKISNVQTQELLLRQLQDNDSAVRDQVLLSLYQMRNAAKMREQGARLVDLSEAAIARVSNYLTTDMSADVRAHAAYLILKLKDKRALQAVRQATADADVWVRLFATQAFGVLADPTQPETLNTLIKLMSDKDYYVRLEALNATATFKLGHAAFANDANQLLARLSTDSYSYIRAALVDVLATDGTQSEETFKTFIRDQSQMVRARGVVALASKQKEQALWFLTNMLNDHKSWARQSTIEASQFLGAKREDFLMAAMKNRDVLVRANAIQALGEIKTDTAAARINESLKADALAERATAAYVVSSRDDDAALALLFTCYQASLDSTWTDLRTDLVQYFISKSTPATTQYLTTVLRDPVAGVAYSAYSELKKRGVEALPILSEPVIAPNEGSDLVFARNPKLKLDTPSGPITIELYASQAQVHVSTIVWFAEKGGYNGLPWHRVVPNFVVQGGDPDKTGWSSGPVTLRAEINPIRFKRGSLGMPRSDSFDSGGVQLFINHVPTPNLDGLYTAFGQVVDGMEVLDHLEPGDLIQKATVER